jgi:hypothetical protein
MPKGPAGLAVGCGEGGGGEGNGGEIVANGDGEEVYHGVREGEIGGGVGENVGNGVADSVGKGVGESVGTGVGVGVGDGIGEGEGVGDAVGDGEGEELEEYSTTNFGSWADSLAWKTAYPSPVLLLNFNTSVINPEECAVLTSAVTFHDLYTSA